MITCRELTELVTDYLEGRLSFADRARFQLHLGLCRHCRAYLQQMRATIAVAGQVSAPGHVQVTAEAMPAEVRAELLHRFRDWHRAEAQPAAEPEPEG